VWMKNLSKVVRRKSQMTKISWHGPFISLLKIPGFLNLGVWSCLSCISRSPQLVTTLGGLLEGCWGASFFTQGVELAQEAVFIVTFHISSLQLVTTLGVLLGG
jgi:hypothetical protein